MTTSWRGGLLCAIPILLYASSICAGETPLRLQPLSDSLPAFQADENPPESGSGSPDTQEAEGPLDLEHALALALMGSPELAAFSWETRAREARMLQASRMPNPELDVRLWRLGEQRGITDVERRRVIFSQVFELGGKRGRRVDLAREERNISELEYEARRIEVATLVVGRFVEVLGAQRRVDSWTRFNEYLESVQTKVQAMVESGSTPSLNLHRVTRQTGLARVERQQAESDLGAARFAMAASWGGTSPRFTEAVGDLEPVDPIPGLDTVIERARQNPAMARWDAELLRGQSAVALAKANRVPDFQFEAGVRWENNVEPDYIVGFEIALPLFDRKQGDIREARYRLSGAHAARQAAAAARNRAIADAYYALAEARTRSRAFGDDVVPASRALFEAFHSVFEAQSSDIDGLLDARRELTNAESDYADALVDSHRALAQLEGLVGDSLEIR